MYAVTPIQSGDVGFVYCKTAAGKVLDGVRGRVIEVRLNAIGVELLENGDGYSCWQRIWLLDREMFAVDVLPAR